MKKPVRPILGVIALACAAMGLILALFGSDLAEWIEPSAPVEEKVADIVVKIKDAVVAKLQDQDAVIPKEESGWSWHTAMPKLALAFAALGIIGGASSYTRGENRAFAISAGGVALVSLVWHGLMLSIGAIVLIAIIFIVLNALQIDISF